MSLNQITIKFWVDDTNYVSNAADTLVGAVFYGGCFGSTCTAVSGVNVSALNFSPACGPVSNKQANWEIKISNTDPVNLSAGATWANIQMAIHVNNFPNFTPGTGNWYSPCGVGGGSTYTNNLNYAVYYQGNLVTASGGVPPSCRPLPTCTPNGAKLLMQVVHVEGTPPFTPTPTPSPAFAPSGLVQSVVAAPNLSRNGSPIQFRVSLGHSASIQISLFSLTGELVNQLNATGSAGLNTLTWALDNRSHSSVASGLYVYLLRVDDGVESKVQTGKVVILH